MYCCISGCCNTSKDNRHKLNNIQFYSFPTHSTFWPWICEKRNLWINAVKKHTRNPDTWVPSRGTRICSAHFVGHKKSENPSHPAYVPTIFSANFDQKKGNNKLLRFERRQRRMHRAKLAEINFFEGSCSENSVKTEGPSTCFYPGPSAAHCGLPRGPAKQSVECQTDLLNENQFPVTYVSCNMVNLNGVCTAEVQANIVIKKIRNTSCQADITRTNKVMKDFSCNTLNLDSDSLFCPGFHGISSLKTEDNLISLSGVTLKVFYMILSLLPDCKTSVVDKETKLLITLMKLKTGLRFSVLSVIFQVHRTTVQRIFESNLYLLHAALKKFVIWPSKPTIKVNMPETFKDLYPNTRVVIDCTEVHTEYPPTVKQRVHMYSDYKHGYTIKFLVGCTPCGFISFVSKCYGGRSGDCFITNDCGIIDLLEPGDTVLADKGFPSIKTSVENKKAILIMPPFLREQQFSSEEVEETYKIASVRIHIERIMQRIKQFHIFDKLPISLLKYRDEIVYVVCALVNVENPIIKQ